METLEKEKKIQDRYLGQITSILSRVFKDKECNIYLFGSRAIGEYGRTSDFDIAVLSSEDVSRELSFAREMLDLSNIPFTVDLIDLNATSEEFLRRVEEQGILLWKN